MTLNEFIDKLQTLQRAGHGGKDVYYRHGASGDCGMLSSAFITDEVNECGPFYLDDGQEYVSIYAGN